MKFTSIPYFKYQPCFVKYIGLLKIFLSISIVSPTPKAGMLMPPIFEVYLSKFVVKNKVVIFAEPRLETLV